MNILYSYGDANFRLPRPHGCRIVVRNGADTSIVSTKHTRTAPNTCCAESKTAFDTSTGVIGLRNLLSKLEIARSKLRCCIKITLQLFGSPDNRGSLGKNSRAKDSEVLTIRNSI